VEDTFDDTFDFSFHSLTENEMALGCIDDLQNIGRSACKKLPQAFKGFIKTPLGWTIAANATQQQWQDALLAVANRIYLFPDAYDFEQQSEETVMATSGLGKQVFVRQGEYRFQSTFLENLEVHKSMYSHLQSGGGMLPIDLENKLIYWDGTDNGDTIKGFTLNNFIPKNLQFGSGSEPSVSPIYFSWKDGAEFNKYGYQIDFTALALNLVPLTTVKLTIVGTPTDTEIQVSVNSVLDGVDLLALVQADFVVSTGSVSGVTDADNDGTYVIAGTGFTSGTVNLVAASALSIPGFESAGAVAFVVAS